MARSYRASNGRIIPRRSGGQFRVTTLQDFGISKNELSDGNMICANCGYGEGVEKWHPVLKTGYCPRCGSQEKKACPTQRQSTNTRVCQDKRPNIGYVERYRNEAQGKNLFRWWDFAIAEIEKTGEALVMFRATQGGWKDGEWIVAYNEFPDLPRTFASYEGAYTWLEEKMTDYFAQRIQEAKQLIQQERWELCSVSLLQRYLPRCGYAGAARILVELQNQGFVSKQSELETSGFRVLFRPLEKQARLEKANQLLSVIASCGRRFFAHQGRVSRFELDARGRVWFVDAYREARIYTHHTNGRWNGFSEGGTLRSLVIALRDYISTGKSIPPGHLGPWPDWYSAGDPWGYGDAMKLVTGVAVELNLSQGRSL